MTFVKAAILAKRKSDDKESKGAHLAQLSELVSPARGLA